MYYCCDDFIVFIALCLIVKRNSTNLLITKSVLFHVPSARRNEKKMEKEQKGAFAVLFHLLLLNSVRVQPIFSILNVLN